LLPRNGHSDGRVIMSASECQFVSVGNRQIRCTVCGVERMTAEAPERYHRICERAQPIKIKPRLRSPFNSTCVHRGEVLERGLCNACGMKGQPFDILACELHGKCMGQRYRNDRPDLKVCVLCDDFKAANTTSTA